MKPIPILVASALVLVLVASPLVATASGSVTFSSPGAGASYKGTQSYSIAGTISPAPGVVDNVFITVKNPSGVTVDAASVPATPSSGAFSYATATGGGANWVTGTYSITATDSYGASGTTTFAYTASGTKATSSSFLTVQAVAASPDFAGQTVQVTALVSFTNGTLATATWTGSHYHSPSGTATPLSAPTSIGSGMYMWTITLPANAANGLYSVHLEANASGNVAWGVAGFTVNSALQPNNAALQHDLAANFTALSNSLSSLSSSMTQLSNAVAAVNTAVGGVSTTLTNIQSSLTTIGQNVNTLSGLGSQLTSATNSIGTTQTYVLVVAVLAAITLVLELAILVRKLS